MIAGIPRLGLHIFKEYLGGKLLGGIRRRGLLLYFRAVNGVRKMLMMVVALTVLLQLMTISFVGTIVTATWILVKDEDVRLWVLFGGFAALFLLPLVGILVLMSERFWMRLSGAGRLIDDSSV